MKKLREQAMDLLARRSHSIRELSIKLTQKGHDPDEVASAVQKLASDGLLDDARFAQDYIRYRASSGYGPVKIKYELSQRGLEAGIAEESLSSCEIDWHECIRRVWQKKFGVQPRYASKEHAAQVRFLNGRGFSLEMINKILMAEVDE